MVRTFTDDQRSSTTVRSILTSLRKVPTFDDGWAVVVLGTRTGGASMTR